jgi:hypothetical protein
VKWTVDGQGATLEHTTQESTNGVYLNSLTTSHQAGDVFTVTAEIVASEDKYCLIGSKATLGPFTVLPGNPDNIEVTSSTNVPADGVSNVEISADITDAYGNPVADGTSISFQAIGDTGSSEELTQTTTVNGIATITLPAGVIVGGRTYEIAASDTAFRQISIDTQPIDLSVSVSAQQLTAGSANTIVLTAIAENAADGTEINWISTYGKIDGDTVITNGQAVATLHAAQSPGKGTVYITVAGEKEIVDIDHVGDGGIYGTLSHAAIVGDETVDGTVTVDQWIGEETYHYVTQSALTLNGEADSTVRVALGTPLSPNAEPVAFFPLQAVNQGMSVAIDGIHTAMVYGDVEQDFDRNALAFADEGYLLLAEAQDLNIDDNFFASLDFEVSELDTASWPVVGQDLKQGPFLIHKGSEGEESYHLCLVEYQGEVRVEAAVQTSTGTYRATHSLPIEVGRPYGAALRYKDGDLEVEVDDYSLSASSIDRVSATGKLINIEKNIVVGGKFTGLVRSLRLGIESDDRLLTKFANGSGHQDITLGANGQGSITISSNGNLSKMPQIIGMTYAPLNSDITYSPQPIRFGSGHNSLGLLSSFLGVKEAHAGWFSSSENTRTRNGIAVVSKESAGWFTSFVDQVLNVADKSRDIVKKAGEIASMVVGLDDFIVLTKSITALAAGARDEIDTIEVTFAAVGATLTIVEIVSAGSLAPAIEPLQGGMIAFKATIRNMGPDGIKAAYSMAKSLGTVITDIIKAKGAKGAAFDMLKYTALTLAHLATNVGEPIFKTFVGVVRSPLDFYNWVKTFKYFNKVGGCVAKFAPDASGKLRYYASASNLKKHTLLGASILSLWVGNAYAVGPNVCELRFTEAIKIMESVASKYGDAKYVDDKVREFINVGEYLDKKIVDEMLLNFTDESLEGVALMLCRERTKKNARNIVRTIAELKDLNNVDKVDKINRYFTLIANLDKYHGKAEISGRLFGDLGKVNYNTKVDDWNLGFVKGVFHQLDFMEDLRFADVTVTSVEKGIAAGGEQRFVDVIAAGRRFECKNYKVYASSNITNVKNSLWKELTQAMAEGTDDAAKEFLNKTHFVFRGSPEGAMKMIKAMEKEGKDTLTSKFPKTRSLFDAQIAHLKNVVNSGTTKGIPDLGELCVFQGKDVPF